MDTTLPLQYDCPHCGKALASDFLHRDEKPAPGKTGEYLVRECFDEETEEGCCETGVVFVVCPAYACSPFKLG